MPPICSQAEEFLPHRKVGPLKFELERLEEARWVVESGSEFCDLLRCDFFSLQSRGRLKFLLRGRHPDLDAGVGSQGVPHLCSTSPSAWVRRYPTQQARYWRMSDGTLSWPAQIGCQRFVSDHSALVKRAGTGAWWKTSSCDTRGPS